MPKPEVGNMSLDIHWKECLRCEDTFACWGEEFPLCGRCARETVARLSLVLQSLDRVASGDYHMIPTDRCDSIRILIEQTLVANKLKG